MCKTYSHHRINYLVHARLREEKEEIEREETISKQHRPNVVLLLRLRRPHQRSPFFIRQNNPTTSCLYEKAVCTLDDPKEGQDGENKGRPLDETGSRLLVCPDGPEGPSNSNSRGKITLRSGEGIGGSRSFEEEPC